jgi:sulfite exporter TauE/SafE/copper chaperone CopZ
VAAAGIQTYTFHVNGMHCKACVLLAESELAEHPKVISARASLRTRSVEIRGDFGNRPPGKIAEKLSALLSQHSLSTTAQERHVGWDEFGVAVPVAISCAALFVLLQELGVGRLASGNATTYGTAFVVGVVASLSTCAAVVGGLVLSISATFARSGERARPQALFHAGRIASFFILGGAIGLLGSAFRLQSTGTFILSFTVALIMLAIGLNLIDVFPWARRFQPSMPRFVSKKALGATGLSSTVAPALVGGATFFLPCGFTQAMQFYAVSTGSAVTGALTMLFFALGTLPVLAALSFTSLAVNTKENQGVFFKSVGLLVILFAVFNAVNSLAALGVIDPVYSR